MDDINDYMFVFYWREDNASEWHISAPVSLGELIEGSAELEFEDGSTLGINDIDWGSNETKVAKVPPREYKHTQA